MLGAEFGREFINDLDVLGGPFKVTEKDQGDGPADHQANAVVPSAAQILEELADDVRVSFILEALSEAWKARSAQILPADCFDGVAGRAVVEPFGQPLRAPVITQGLDAVPDQEARAEVQGRALRLLLDR